MPIDDIARRHHYAIFATAAASLMPLRLRYAPPPMRCRAATMPAHAMHFRRLMPPPRIALYAIFDAA